MDLTQSCAKQLMLWSNIMILFYFTEDTQIEEQNYGIFCA